MIRATLAPRQDLASLPRRRGPQERGRVFAPPAPLSNPISCQCRRRPRSAVEKGRPKLLLMLLTPPF